MKLQTAKNNVLFNGGRMIDFHRSLLAEKGRCKNYRRAIFNTVRPNDIVVDIGCGTGILAFFACQAGAKKVYAIEVEKIVDLAKRVSQKNRFQDRIVFLNDLSYHVKLPERADVLVTETFDTFGTNGGLLNLVIDARQRFLKRSGRIIPRLIHLFVVPVELPQIYQKIDFWINNLYGLDFSQLRFYTANQIFSVNPEILQPDTFLSKPRSLARINLSRIKTANIGGAVSFIAKRDSNLHGIAGWFSAQLSKKTSISNAPNIMNPKWNDAFFPLERPIPLKKGNRIHVIVESKNNGSVWRWRVSIDALGVSCDQSNFWGWPLKNGKQL